MTNLGINFNNGIGEFFEKLEKSTEITPQKKDQIKSSIFAQSIIASKARLS